MDSAPEGSPRKRRKGLALHWQILLGLLLGALFGVLAAHFGFSSFVLVWIKPVGDLFFRLLKVVAIPLVVATLVVGAASLGDLKKIGRIGGRTLVLYLATTALAITIGLLVVNLFGPGRNLDPSLRAALLKSYGGALESRRAVAGSLRPLDQLVRIVPDNFFGALAKPEMIQVVFFSLLLGVALTRIRSDRARPVIAFFEGLSDAVIAMVQGIMKIAPYGVFALIAAVIADLGKDSSQAVSLLEVLAGYMGCVVLGLALHMALVYTPLIRFLARIPLGRFYRSLAPAQLLAFSSSSSGATLPVTMECVEEGLGVDREISSFVLPLGATVNMDGTALYQGVAAVFIANVYGMHLGIQDMLTIVLTATLASIGTAAVPGVGIVMLIVVLQQIHVPPEGIALILGVDRPLDMCRTVLNVTGDATVCASVARAEGAIQGDAGKPG